MSTFGGVFVKIYKIADTAEKHEFRETIKYRDKNYGLLKKVKVQPRWFAHNELRFKDELMKASSLGYFIFEASVLKKLGISPAPDGEAWESYILAPYINGTYSSTLLNITEIRPESYWRGRHTLWYVYFNEAKPMPVADTKTSPIENRKPDTISRIVEVTREY